MNLGQFEKMKLVAYTDIQFSKEAGYEYELLINPESYSITSGTEVMDQSAQGSGERLSAFHKRSPQTISFKIIFDGTGVIRRGSGPVASALAEKPDVVEDFNQFKQVVYSYEKSTHQPRFVQIRWGLLLYNCKLISMSMSFKLFKPDGTPIRAEADCTFQGVIDEQKLNLIDEKHSPDLTHIRTVIDGDTLPLLCFREYGNSKYYYQVALINGLNDFKQLSPGMKLIFPPFAK